VRKSTWAAMSIAVVATSSILSASSGGASITGGGRSNGPPRGLTVYGQTLWQLEALLQDTFRSKAKCLRLRDSAFVSASCGDLADYGYWKNVFVGAKHSRFRLVRRPHPPVTGNVRDITVRGLYVFCGDFPVAFAPLAHEGSRTKRWLVELHGWAMTPFTCLGQ
jgi:hypothetical protein